MTFDDQQRWLRPLTAHEAAKLHAAAALDANMRLGHHIRETLLQGIGFCLLRGFPERWNEPTATFVFAKLCSELGALAPQDQRGTLVADVIDRGKSTDDPTTRFYETREALECHTDGADFTALLCLQPAPNNGGATRIVNAVALHDRMMREEPELAAALYQNVPFDFRDALPGNRPWYVMPVFKRVGAELEVFLLRQYARSSQRHADAPRLQPITDVALNWLQSAAENDDRYALTIDLQRGDILFLNNKRLLHGRTAYRDVPGYPTRHLKRIWIKR